MPDLARTPDGVLAALEMDHSLRLLYVEGPSDRLFVRWIAGRANYPAVLISEMDAIDTDVPGGAKKKLVDLATRLGVNDRLRFFADADYDRLLERVLPPQVLLTDARDMEGYVLHAECLEKVLRLGTHTDNADPSGILAHVVAACREVGLLRVASEQNGWAMPFRSVRPTGKAIVRNLALEFDFEGYLMSLVDQSVGRSRLGEVRAALVILQRDLNGVPDAELVHGKDALDLLALVLAQCGVVRSDGPALLRTAFERNMVPPTSTLASIVDFVVGRAA